MADSISRSEAIERAIQPVLTWDRHARGPEGRRLCKWCRKEIPRGRRGWCSDQCVEQYRIRANQGFMAAFVFRRDHGVCKLCGLDTQQLEKIFRYLWARASGQRAWRRSYDRRTGKPTILYRARPGWQDAFKVKYRWFKVYRSPWEADHEIPLADGGDAGPDNVRTLCCACHASVTKKAATARAVRRRAEAGH